MEKFKEELEERELMSQEEFEDYINSTLFLKSFIAVQKFKSVRRAIKRGHITPDGIIYPNRPFHNRANTSKRNGVHSRKFNEEKKRIYFRLKNYGRI